MQFLCLNIKRFLLPPAVLFFSCGLSFSQPLKVINNYREYKDLAATDSLQKMIEVKMAIPSITYDLRYVTKANFTGEKLYKEGNKTFLRLPVATALRAAAKELAAQGYTLKIWDAYRPYSATKKMWSLIHDDRYVADPARGSGHNRGLAVDLTLMKGEEEVDMGTGFDNFSDSAHHDFTKLPETVLHNRLLLRSTMEKYGFKALQTEWWHYSFPNDGRYDVLDIDLKKLAY